jgi:hypothetical protein
VKTSRVPAWLTEGEYFLPVKMMTELARKPVPLTVISALRVPNRTDEGSNDKLIQT